MSVHKLVVWTRVRAGSSAAWARLSDPVAVGAALPAPWKLRVDDPDGLRTALSAPLAPGSGWSFRAEVRGGPLAVRWPLHLLDVTPGLRFTTSTSNGWFRRFVHRRRVERAIGGRVRLVDEVVLEPGWAVPALAVAATRRVLVSTQRRLVADLQPEATHAQHFALGAADAAHAEDLMAGIDLGPP